MLLGCLREFLCIVKIKCCPTKIYGPDRIRPIKELMRLEGEKKKKIPRYKGLLSYERKRNFVLRDERKKISNYLTRRPFADENEQTSRQREVTSALLASWERIGYLMERNRVNGWSCRGVGHRHFHSLNKTQQRKLPLHVPIL
ncbi:hypothetical protein EVAR_19103_1 [Eumeta japonica]|uniref:Uncharacterized protein n=1 Tax=Eumeta variegata TaxID=151549 RepID=A0A4C1UP55_EUMVA|nr:hypothetical protein EVAR_19103_1 [Eumeta japonica]